MKKAFAVLLFLIFVSFVGRGQNIDVSFFQTDIRDALMQLSYQVGKPIIYDQNVVGFVTLEAHNMPFEKVLDLVLMPYGYQWVKIGDVYFVGVPDPESPSFLTLSRTYIYRTKGLSGSDLIKMLPDVMKKYVFSSSEDSSIVVITAPPKIASRVAEVLNRMDVPNDQILVEVKVVEINGRSAEKWELPWTFEKGGQNENLSLGFLGEEFDVIYRSGNIESVFNLRTLLQSGEARLLANPKVVVLNGKKATVSVKTTRSVVVEEDDKKILKSFNVGIQIELVPTVLSGGKVVLSERIISNGLIGDQYIPDTSEQEFSGTVVMKMAEEKVIGGIGYETYTKVEKKLPLLGDIPILGYLFKAESYERLHKEIIIIARCTRVGGGK